jgi:hypothetical protein
MSVRYISVSHAYVKRRPDDRDRGETGRLATKAFEGPIHPDAAGRKPRGE